MTTPSDTVTVSSSKPGPIMRYFRRLRPYMIVSSLAVFVTGFALPFSHNDHYVTHCADGACQTMKVKEAAPTANNQQDVATTEVPLTREESDRFSTGVKLMAVSASILLILAYSLTVIVP